MKPSVLVFAIGLVLGGTVLAQDAGVRAEASGQSASSVSASGNNAGASTSHRSGASAPKASQHEAANVAEGTELNATLSQPVDVLLAIPGDEVTATLAQDATGSAGARLPRGTKLIGHVTEAQPHRRKSSSANGSSDSRLGIVFDKAVRPDGSEVPVSATLQAVAAGNAAAGVGQHALDRSDGGAFATHGASAAGGATVVGRAASIGSTALGGVAGVGTGFRTVSSSAGSVADVSAAAVGGVDASGQLLSGSRGVFGMRGVEILHGTAGSAQGSVLTSQTRSVQLGRGTRMLLVNQAARNDANIKASGAAATNASATEQRRE
jgi:hypothetical protein